MGCGDHPKAKLGGQKVMFPVPNWMDCLAATIHMSMFSYLLDSWLLVFFWKYRQTEERSEAQAGGTHGTRTHQAFCGPRGTGCGCIWWAGALI